MPVKLRPVYPYYVHSVFLFLQSPGTWAFGSSIRAFVAQVTWRVASVSQGVTLIRRLRRDFSFQSTVASSQVSSNSRERQFVWACTVRPAELSALSYTLRVRGDVLLARIECCGASGDCGAKKLIVLDFFVGLYVT